MLLADSPVVTPDVVLHLPQDTQPGGTCWWLLWADPSREKRVCATLAEAGAVPLVITNTRTKPKRKNGAGRDFTPREDVNLFTGYIFANGKDRQVWEAKEKHWAQVMRVGMQSRTVEQIARMMEISAAEENLLVEKIVKGDWVEVTAGRWLGYRGIVSDVKDDVVYFPIEILGQAVPIPIPREDVELVTD